MNFLLYISLARNPLTFLMLSKDFVLTRNVVCFIIQTIMKQNLKCNNQFMCFIHFINSFHTFISYFLLIFLKYYVCQIIFLLSCFYWSWDILLLFSHASKNSMKCWNWNQIFSSFWWKPKKSYKFKCVCLPQKYQ